MCVSQFRNYVNCSYFKRDVNGSYSKDLDDKNLKVRPNSYIRHKNSEGEYDGYYYVTNLKKVKKLAALN